MQLVDVTGDGLLDLLVADHCGGLYLFGGDGKGNWVRLALLRSRTGEGFNDVAALDFDGDGRMDLAALAAFTTGISLFRQETDGSFVIPRGDLPRSGFGYALHSTDLDGDSRPDLYGTLQGIDPRDRARGEREAKVWLQRPGGHWEAGAGLPESGAFYGAALGDVNEDGLPDLVLSRMDEEGGLAVFLGTAPGVWGALSGPAPGQGRGRLFTGLAFADFDRDGHLDLVAVEYLKPAIVVWVGDGAGHFTECPGAVSLLPNSYKPGWGLVVGDINRDGQPDLAAGFGDGGGALRAWASHPGRR